MPISKGNINTLKIALIGLSVLAGAGEISRRFVTLFETGNQLVALAAFCLLLAFCLISLVGAGLIRNGFYRWPLSILLAAGSVTIDSYQWAVCDFMDYEAFVTMMQSIGDIGDAAAQHGTAMAMALASASTCQAGGKVRQARCQASRSMTLPDKVPRAPIVIRCRAGTNDWPVNR